VGTVAGSGGSAGGGGSVASGKRVRRTLFHSADVFSRFSRERVRRMKKSPEIAADGRPQPSGAAPGSAAGAGAGSEPGGAGHDEPSR
jgi:hypothetical protein